MSAFAHLRVEAGLHAGRRAGNEREGGMATPELHASCSASRWSNFAFRLSFSSIRSLSEPIFIWIHRPCKLDTNHRVLQPNSRCCKRAHTVLAHARMRDKNRPPKGSTQPGWNGRGRNGDRQLRHISRTLPHLPPFRHPKRTIPHAPPRWHLREEETL